MDPMVSAQKSMREDMPKRFWKEATLGEADGLLQVLLDGRPARTPGRNPVASAHQKIAERMRAEWADVGERLDPLSMPMTRLVNVARDMQPESRAAILDDVRNYAGSDLLCYRAERPQGLVDRQATVWDPYLDRLRTHHGVSMKLIAGIMHQEQDRDVLDSLRALADRRASDTEALAALSLGTSLSGSAILALALTEPGEDSGRAKIVWQAAHVDEDWNRAQWGEDEDATAMRAQKWRDFEAAAYVLSVTRT